jgi:predicted 3-demethylubiquinone-9 3-methyltransferase (glyoxalase superfamily)
MTLMGDPDKEKADRVTQAMLKMKKIDVYELRRVYAGE